LHQLKSEMYVCGNNQEDESEISEYRASRNTVRADGWQRTTHHSIFFGFLNLLQSCIGGYLAADHISQFATICQISESYSNNRNRTCQLPILLPLPDFKTHVNPSITGISKSKSTIERGVAFGPQCLANVVFFRKNKASAPWLATWTMQLAFRSCCAITFWLMRLSCERARQSAQELRKSRQTLNNGTSPLQSARVTCWDQLQNQRPDFEKLSVCDWACWYNLDLWVFEPLDVHLCCRRLGLVSRYCFVIRIWSFAALYRWFLSPDPSMELAELLYKTWILNLCLKWMRLQYVLLAIRSALCIWTVPSQSPDTHY